MDIAELLQIKATITDSQAIATISVARLIDYLERAGWQRSDKYQHPQGLGARYRHPYLGSAELLVPLKESLADYAPRMAEIITALAVVEHRSQLAIFVDMGGRAKSAK